MIRALALSIAAVLPAAALSPVDAAALRMMEERLSRDSASRELQERFEAELASLRAGSPPRASLRRFKFRFVPGFFYKRDRSTGADFSAQIAQFRAAGLDACLIETDEVGTVEHNSRMIREALGSEEGPVVLVSASKGGPETALALSELPAGEAGKVAAWASVGGLHRGTVLADEGLRWPRRWLARLLLGSRALQAIRSVTVAESRPRWERRVRLPERLVTLQLVGVPLSTQVGGAARRRWKRLARLGPNDGLTTLEDQLLDGTLVLFLPGVDHFFRDEEIGLKTLAVANVLLDHLELGARAAPKGG